MSPTGSAPRTRRPKTIEPGASMDLAWFFGAGQVAFERSVFGAILDRVEASAYVSGQCRACQGAGIVWETGAWCDRCAGTGSVPVRRPSAPQGEPLTARPRGTQASGGGYLPDDGQLARYAVISRRLRSIAACHARALEAYYGDCGSRWARGRHGRLLALYALTPAGRRLVHQDEVGQASRLRLTPSERVGVQCDLEAAQPKAARRALLAEAETEARAMLAAAERAYHAATGR